VNPCAAANRWHSRHGGHRRVVRHEAYRKQWFKIDHSKPVSSYRRGVMFAPYYKQLESDFLCQRNSVYEFET
jgi:hypothetical protein